MTIENESNDVPLELQTHDFGAVASNAKIPAKNKKEITEFEEVPLETQTHNKKESKKETSKSNVTSPTEYPEVKRAFDVAGGVAGAATSAGLMAPSAAYKKGLDFLNLMGMDPSYVPGGLHRYVNSQIDPIATGLNNAEIRPKDLKTATGVPFLRTGKEAQEAIKIAQGLPVQTNPIFVNGPNGTVVNLSQLTGQYHQIPGTQPIDLSPYAISKNVASRNPKLDMATNAVRSTVGRGFLGGYNAVDALQQDNPLQTGIATAGTVGSLMPYIEKPLPTSFRQKALPKQLGALASLGAPLINLLLDQFKSNPDKDIGVLTEKAEGGIVGYADGRSISDYRQEPTMQAYEPSYSEQIKDYSKNYFGLSNKEADAIFGGTTASFVDTINPFNQLAQTPGDVADSAEGFMRSAKRGDYPEAIMHAIMGGLSLAGGASMLRGVAKGVAKGVTKGVTPKTIEELENIERLFNKNAFLKNSKVPNVMYHGTGADISEFVPKQANAIFLSPNAKFAGQYAESGENFLAKDFLKKLQMEDEDKFRLLKKAAINIANKSGSSQAYELENLAKNRLTSRANVMPVHVNATNPFDFANEKHLKTLKNNLLKNADSKLLEKDPDFAIRQINNLSGGNWAQLESPRVQQAIKDLGHDSFWVQEGGHKNLGVYQPTQIKSAIGNQGTFDATNPNIIKKTGGLV